MNTLSITPELFGAIGDGINDDTLALEQLFNINSPSFSNITFEKNKIYTSTKELSLENASLNLNGSTLRFDLSGLTKNLQVKSNSSVYGGTIENNGVDFGGAGHYQCPIQIGDYGTGDSYENIVCENLTIISNKPNGNGIFITSESNNIRISNIKFPCSSNIARPILIHWGNADNPTVETLHPFNINIDNITVGDMSYTSVDSSVVYISGAYNISVNNIKAGILSYERGLVAVFAGDYGNFYSRDSIKPMVLRNIKLENLTSDLCDQKAVFVSGKGSLDPSNDLLYAPYIKNVKAKGNKLDSGVSISHAKGGLFENIDLSYFKIGLTTGENVDGLTIVNSSISYSEQMGFNITNNATKPKNIKIIGCKAFMNAQDGTNDAGIRCNVSDKITISDCVLGKEGVESQIWGVRVDNASTNIVIKNNHIENTKLNGVGFSIGSTTVYTTVQSFTDNSSEDGLLFTSGMSPLIINTKLRASKRFRELLGSSHPNTGYWNKGDIVKKESSSVDSSGKVITGWYRATTNNNNILGVDWVVMYNI